MKQPRAERLGAVFMPYFLLTTEHRVLVGHAAAVQVQVGRAVDAGGRGVPRNGAFAPFQHHRAAVVAVVARRHAAQPHQQVQVGGLAGVGDEQQQRLERRFDRDLVRLPVGAGADVAPVIARQLCPPLPTSASRAVSAADAEAFASAPDFKAASSLPVRSLKSFMRMASSCSHVGRS